MFKLYAPIASTNAIVRQTLKRLAHDVEAAHQPARPTGMPLQVSKRKIQQLELPWKVLWDQAGNMLIVLCIWQTRVGL